MTDVLQENTNHNQQQEGSEQYKFLTLNLFLRPPLITNHGNDYKEQRIEYLLKHYLKEFTLVGLQETFAFGSSRRARLIKSAESLGFKYHLASSIPPLFKGTDGGLVLLSKWPIIESKEMVFSQGIHSDRLALKGALYAKLQVTPEFNIRVFNTHTQASYSENPGMSDPSVRVRLAQIYELRKFIDQCVKDNPQKEPIFLLGDFNVNARASKFEDSKDSSEEYKAMYRILSQGEPVDSSSSSEVTSSPSSSLEFKDFKDLLFLNAQHHPVTFGDSYINEDGKRVPMETALTSTSSYCSMERLDYILYLGSSSSSHNVAVDSTQVEALPITEPIPRCPCTQLSDHYGVSANVTISKTS